MRFAAIDIGTNSCRLLITEKEGSKIIPVFRTMETTRLGEKMSNSSCLTSEAMNRTVKCLLNFKNIIQEYSVNTYRAVATSAVREADNKEDFIKLVKEKCQLDVDIISGEEEARLSYLGVKNGLEFLKPPVVVDLGGGSTEFIFETDFRLSLPVGAVRVNEFNMSAYDIKEVLNPIANKKDYFRENPLVFVGGTATSLVAIKFSLEVYRSDLVHGQVLTLREITDLYNMLERMPLSLRKRLPGLQPERADIITGGVLTLLIIMQVLDKNEITVSESDIMEGIISEM